jgi:transposase InsO family protein
MKPWIKRLNNHIYYGWMIVFLSALTFFMSSPGQTYSISIFNDIYKDTFNLSSTEISTAYSLATVLSGLLLVFMGRAVNQLIESIDRYIAFYNHERYQAKLKGLTPIEYRNQALKQSIL